MTPTNARRNRLSRRPQKTPVKLLNHTRSRHGGFHHLLEASRRIETPSEAVKNSKAAFACAGGSERGAAWWPGTDSGARSIVNPLKFVRLLVAWCGRMPSCARVGNPHCLPRLAIGAQVNPSPTPQKQICNAVSPDAIQKFPSVPRECDGFLLTGGPEK
jgi:hypothetical protein